MDPEAIFRMLDHDGTGAVTKEAFIAQWQKLQKTLAPFKEAEPVIAAAAERQWKPESREPVAKSALAAPSVTSTPAHASATPQPPIPRRCV
jgi:hypothetical protein